MKIFTIRSQKRRKKDRLEVVVEEKPMSSELGSLTISISEMSGLDRAEVVRRAKRKKDGTWLSLLKNGHAFVSQRAEPRDG